MPAYAHTHPDHPGDPTRWEQLFTPFGEANPDEPTKACPGRNGEPCQHCERMEPYHGHLNKVAWHAATFAADMFPSGPDRDAARQWAYLAGLWHDLGKFSEEFQQRLRGERERANHSTAGAQLSASQLHTTLLAYPIAGHHAGLADYVRGDSGILARLNGLDYLSTLERPSVFQVTTSLAAPPSKEPKSLALHTRFLFSALVDADFLATEAFMNSERHQRRCNWPKDILLQMEGTLQERYHQFGDPDSAIARLRHRVHIDCIDKAGDKPGFFSLTVPTGGGKTLASLSFALRHSLEHDLRRIIYVAPYTSIIEQNASEYRTTFAGLAAKIGRDPVLEHHSNFETDISSDHEEPLWKLSAENWDAPLIVTTSVQLYESLYANRTSRCRKLHRIARSVIILDEFQNLPPNLLAPCLDILKRLVAHYGVTVVLCTATQPAVGKLSADQPGDFAKSFNKIALRPAREIVSDISNLFASLQRVRVENAGSLGDDELVSQLSGHQRILCILNSKPHAARVLEKLGVEDPANLHLSAQLCPAHRRLILAEIKRREQSGEPCRLIATTVVEAGVDLDFPAVYRAQTGLDSLAQAAGRCNRHNHLGPAGGLVRFFSPSDQKPPAFLSQAIAATQAVLPDHSPSDLLLPEAIESYFLQYFFLLGGSGGQGWDRHDILKCFRIAEDNPGFPFAFDFQSAAERFRLIPDNQAPVIVPPVRGCWDQRDESRSAEILDLLDRIRSADQLGYPAPRQAHRALQSHTVQIPKNIHAAMIAEDLIRPCCDGRFPILVHPENDYHPKLGLLLPDHLARPGAFVV